MAAREVVLRYLSTFDATGAEAAARGNLGVAKSVDTLSESKQRLGKHAVDLEIKQRKLEGVTRVLTSEFVNTARAGFSMEAAATAGASAISFLGNTMRFASGPIGALVTIGATLAATFLLTSTKAQETQKEIQKVADATDIYAKTLSVLASVGASENSELVKQTKTAKILAENLQALEEIETERKRAGVERFNMEAVLTDETRKLAAARSLLITETQKVVREEYILLNAKQKVSDQERKVEDATKAARHAAEVEAIFARQLEIVSAAIAVQTKETVKATAATTSWMGVKLYMNAALEQALEVIDEDEMELEHKRQQRAQAEIERVQRERAMKIAAAQQIAGTMGALANYLEQTGKASFETIKALRYAEALVNTAAGVAQALGSGPPPYNFIAAAAVAAAGAIQVATIASTSPGGGGSISAPSGALGGGATPAAGGGGTLTAPGAGGGGPGALSGATVTISIESLVFQGLDPDSVPAGQMRRFVRRFAELLAFELNGLGNTMGR